MPSLLIIANEHDADTKKNAATRWLETNFRAIFQRHQVSIVATPTREQIADASAIVLCDIANYPSVAGLDLHRKNFHILDTKVDTTEFHPGGPAQRDAVAAFDSLICAWLAASASAKQGQEPAPEPAAPAPEPVAAVPEPAAPAVEPPVAADPAPETPAEADAPPPSGAQLLKKRAAKTGGA